MALRDRAQVRQRRADARAAFIVHKLVRLWSDPEVEVIPPLDTDDYTAELALLPDEPKWMAELRAKIGEVTDGDADAR
jgi:hypothetical protein